MAKTILIIDDEETTLELLSRFFKVKGFNVIIAESIEKAKNFVHESDIVLSDIKIGGENGIEFLEEIRSKGIDKPFLMKSWLFSESEGEKALELTGHPVIYKHMNIEKLVEIVKKIITK